MLHTNGAICAPARNPGVWYTRRHATAYTQKQNGASEVMPARPARARKPASPLPFSVQPELCFSRLNSALVSQLESLALWRTAIRESDKGTLFAFYTFVKGWMRANKHS